MSGLSSERKWVCDSRVGDSESHFAKIDTGLSRGSAKTALPPLSLRPFEEP